jgi:hypothetical protein
MDTTSTDGQDTPNVAASASRIPQGNSDLIKAEDLLKNIFDGVLAQGKFDQDIVKVLKAELLSGSIHSQAGKRIATELEKLAKQRAAAPRSTE